MRKKLHVRSPILIRSNCRPVLGRVTVFGLIKLIDTRDRRWRYRHALRVLKSLLRLSEGHFFILAREGCDSSALRNFPLQPLRVLARSV
jgi:hypothetical protein